MQGSGRVQKKQSKKAVKKSSQKKQSRIAGKNQANSTHFIAFSH
jgi:hypothetical protein